MILSYLLVCLYATLCGGFWKTENKFWWALKLAVYKSGTGTRGQGHRDACVRTWDLGTRDEGLEDVKVWDMGTCGTGTQGRQIQGSRGRGVWIIIAKIRGKCDISHFPCEYVLVKATHPALLSWVPPCLFTKQKLGKDPLHWRKWNRCPRLLADVILEPKVG